MSLEKTRDDSENLQIANLGQETESVDDENQHLSD